MNKLRTLLLSAILAVVAFPAFAADLCRVPVVDGTFSEIEWTGAFRFGSDILTPEGDLVPGEVLITNDNETIYVAIRYFYARSTDNSFSVSFDVNHSRQIDQGDDELVGNWSIWGSQTGFDTYRVDDPACPGCSYADTTLGGTNDIVTASSHGADGWFTSEMSHPINGADKHDIKAAPGQYISLRFSNRIFSAGGMADTTIPNACLRFVPYRLRSCGQQ